MRAQASSLSTQQTVLEILRQTAPRRICRSLLSMALSGCQCRLPETSWRLAGTTDCRSFTSMEAIRLRRTRSGWPGRIMTWPGMHTNICTQSTREGCTYGGSRLPFGHTLRPTHCLARWLLPFCPSNHLMSGADSIGYRLSNTSSRLHESVVHIGMTPQFQPARIEARNCSNIGCVDFQGLILYFLKNSLMSLSNSTCFSVNQRPPL